jgi:hypothetical protein
MVGFPPLRSFKDMSHGIYRGIAKEIEKVKEHRVVNHRQGEWARGKPM